MKWARNQNNQKVLGFKPTILIMNTKNCYNIDSPENAQIFITKCEDSYYVSMMNDEDDNTFFFEANSGALKGLADFINNYLENK